MWKPSEFEQVIPRKGCMIAKYHVEYAIQFRNHPHVSHYQTDDPVACVEFLSELLERDVRIVALRHEGVELERVEGDRLLKTAASMLAARRLCAALALKPDEEHHRFGFTV